MKKPSSELIREMIEEARRLWLETDAYPIEEPKERQRKEGLEESQVRNLCKVAESANCFEELELYIRYQTARHNKEKDGWVKGSFYERLIAILRKLHEEGDMEAVKLFCGYLARWHKVAKENVLEEKE